MRLTKFPQGNDPLPNGIALYDTATNELDRYREHQFKAYGAIVASWATYTLQQRLQELDGIDRDGVSEMRRVRLDAEALAIGRELAGRKAPA